MQTNNTIKFFYRIIFKYFIENGQAYFFYAIYDVVCGIFFSVICGGGGDGGGYADFHPFLRVQTGTYRPSDTVLF